MPAGRIDRAWPTGNSVVTKIVSHRGLRHRAGHRPEAASCVGLPVVSNEDARTDLNATAHLRAPVRLKVLVAVPQAAARVPGHLFVRSPPQLVVAIGR